MMTPDGQRTDQWERDGTLRQKKTMYKKTNKRHISPDLNGQIDFFYVVHCWCTFCFWVIFVCVFKWVHTLHGITCLLSVFLCLHAIIGPTFDLCFHFFLSSQLFHNSRTNSTGQHNSICVKVWFSVKCNVQTCYSIGVPNFKLPVVPCRVGWDGFRGAGLDSVALLFSTPCFASINNFYLSGLRLKRAKTARVWLLHDAFLWTGTSDIII